MARVRFPDDAPSYFIWPFIFSECRPMPTHAGTLPHLPGLCRTLPEPCRLMPKLKCHTMSYTMLCRTLPEYAGALPAHAGAKIPYNVIHNVMPDNAGPCRTLAGPCRTLPDTCRTLPGYAGHLPDLAGHWPKAGPLGPSVGHDILTWPKCHTMLYYFGRMSYNVMSYTFSTVQLGLEPRPSKCRNTTTCLLH